jgi:plastocyanin
MRRFARAAIAAACLLASSQSIAQMREPGGTPQDVHMAVNQPFEYAWRLFFFVNHQASAGTAGEADPSKATIRDYDPDKPLVWETWANATGGLFLRAGEVNTSEVYKDGGVDPGPWEQLPRGVLVAKRLDPNTTTLVANARRDLLQFGLSDPRRGSVTVFSHPSVAIPGEFEVRMNKSTYETIRRGRLYSVEGLAAKFEEAKRANNIRIIQFELESKEVKAKWVKLANEADKLRYHWRTIDARQPDGSTKAEVWGLSGLHIITKDVPNWFWTDFEHVDQEPVALAEGRPSIDPTTRGPSAPSGSNGVRRETVGSKWEFYRLRGVQLEFFDQFGNATQLSNTLIEPLSSGPSSCITCHAKAAVSNRVNHTSAGSPFMINALNPDFVAGAPDPRAFRRDGRPDGEILYLPTDFLWSMAFRARNEPVVARPARQWVIRMSNFSYDPPVLEVKVGDEVIWENGDAMGHSATRVEAANFDTGIIAPGARSAPIRFTQASDPSGIAYFCRPHTFMVGRVIVRN